MKKYILLLLMILSFHLMTAQIDAFREISTPDIYDVLMDSGCSFKENVYTEAIERDSLFKEGMVKYNNGKYKEALIFLATYRAMGGGIRLPKAWTGIPQGKYLHSVEKIKILESLRLIYIEIVKLSIHMDLEDFNDNITEDWYRKWHLDKDSRNEEDYYWGKVYYDWEDYLFDPNPYYINYTNGDNVLGGISSSYCGLMSRFCDDNDVLYNDVYLGAELEMLYGFIYELAMDITRVTFSSASSRFRESSYTTASIISCDFIDSAERENTLINERISHEIDIKCTVNSASELIECVINNFKQDIDSIVYR